MAREGEGDAVFGRLDCNDNTPVLQPQQNKTRTQPGLPSEWSAGGVAPPAPTASPLRCASRASNASGATELNAANQALALITSREDNYNNDFFYDDEFSVQFDANLDGEGRPLSDVPVPDDVDINAILQQLPQVESEAGEASDGGNPPSRSGSGLFPGDMSTSEGLDTSQDQSFSEHDCASSSELSELRSEPLFSPLPPSQEEATLSTDSLGKDTSLSNSLLTDHDFSCDWSATKQQYMISFAGSMHKNSDTDSMASSSTCGGIQGSLTCWAKRSKEDSPAKYIWGSDTSSVLGPRSGATSPVPPRSPEKPPRKLPEVITWQRDEEPKREHPNREEDENTQALTTWRSLKETGSPKVEPAGVRSKSLPELAQRARQDSAGDENTVEIDGLEDSVESSHSAESEGRHSENLYQMFQRLRSTSDEEDHRESVSPSALNQLMGTWSMSPASSDRSLTSIGSTNDASSRLASWTTVPHLTSKADDTKPGRRLRTIVEPDGLIKDPKNVVDAMVGSGVITGSQIWGPPKKPPRVANSSVQTSLDGKGLGSMIEQAQQTSIAAFDRELAARARHWLSVLEIPPQIIIKYLAEQQLERPPVNRDKLSNAVFYSNSSLPDLTFLERGMTQSEALLAIMGKDPLSPYIKEAVLRQKDFKSSHDGSRRRSRSYDSSSCYSSGSSGIDPGSLNDSQGKAFCDLPSFPSTRAQDLLSESEYSDLVHLKHQMGYEPNPEPTSMEKRKVHTSATKDMSLEKRVGAACKVCKKKKNIMSMSIPMYKGQVFARTPRDADFFDIFQPQDWYNMTMSANMPRIVQQLQSPTPRAACHPKCIQNKPLKSCLVKKRQKQQRLFRNSSFSDHKDLAVMKYSQEGQTRYQLLATAEGRECVHGLSGKPTAAPTTATTTQVSPQPKVDTPQSSPETPPAPCCPHKAGCAHQTLLPNSPDLIPVMPCPCQSSSDGKPSAQQQDDEDTCPIQSGHQSRAKKSVSFSEEISYHSPYPSPHSSPQKQAQGQSDVAPPVRPRSASLDCMKSRPTEGNPLSLLAVRTDDDQALDSSGESPPNDFTVSPSISPPQSFIASTTAVEFTPKRELVLRVARSAEVILTFFSQAKDHQQRVYMGSSAQCPEIGHLVLQYLCPAIHAVLQDGLRPYTRSLFGQVRNCVWALVEESCQQGPATRSLHTLVQDLSNLAFLDSNWLRFNAFVFGLLNHKALDFWLTYLQHQDRLLCKHYEPDSVMHLSTTRIRHLFQAMTTALQPLAQLPLRLEYTFEYRHQQQRHADFLLDKHVSAAEEAHLEGQILLREMQHPSHSLTTMRQSAPGRLQPSQANNPSVCLAERTLGASHESVLPAPLLPLPPTELSALPSAIPELPPPTYQEAVSQGSRPGWVSCRGMMGRLQEQTNLISLDALNSTLPVNSLLPKPSTRPLTPTRVPVLQGINDGRGDSTTSQTSIKVDLISAASTTNGEDGAEQEMLLQVTTTVSAAPVCQLPSPHAVPIVKDNKILVPERYEDLAPASSREGLLNKMSHKLGPQLPEDKVYKRGITEYEFDLEMDGKAVNLTKATVKNIHSDVDAPTKAVDWTQDSGIDELRSQELSQQNLAILRAAPSLRHDITKRWSEGEATALLSDSSSCSSLSNSGKMEAGITQVKKRWSTFGPKIIQFFDKLLLDENQKPGLIETLNRMQPEMENERNEEQEKNQSRQEKQKQCADEPVIKKQEVLQSPSKGFSKLPIAKDSLVKRPSIASPTRNSSPWRRLPPTPEVQNPVDLVECTQGQRQSTAPAAASKGDVRSPASPSKESRIPMLSKKPTRVAAPASMKSSTSSMTASKTKPGPTSQQCTLPSGVSYKKEVVGAAQNIVTVYPQHVVETMVKKPVAQKAKHASPSRRPPTRQSVAKADMVDSRSSSVSDASATSRRVSPSPRRSSSAAERRSKDKPLRIPGKKLPEVPGKKAQDMANNKIQNKVSGRVPGKVATKPKVASTIRT